MSEEGTPTSTPETTGALNFLEQTGGGSSGIKWSIKDKVAGHLARILEKTGKFSKSWHAWVKRETLARSGRPLRGYPAQPFTHMQRTIDDAIRDGDTAITDLLKDFGVDITKSWAQQNHADIIAKVKAFMGI